jgi:ketosteroid isomerase-like protein
VSEADVDLIREGFEGMAREGWEAMLPMLAPDFELTTPPDLAAEPDTYRGEEGMRRYFESFYEAMEEVRFQPHEYREVGGWIVVPYTLTTRGRTTGLVGEQPGVMAWKVRDGKAVQLEVYRDLDGALAAISPPG